jgi:hypothetical protein
MHTLESIRSLLTPWGTLKPQPATDWNGTIVLPTLLEEFYLQLGPVELSISAGGNPVFIPSLKNLWARQACYRWHGITGERLADWQDNWLVIATEGSNPFILDTETGAVYFDLAGGKPSPKLFCSNLVTGFGAIATVANTLTELGDDAYDDTSELTSVARTTVVNSLNRFLSDAANAEQMLEAWQWYT